MLEFEIPQLHPISEYYLTNSVAVRQYYDDHWVKGCDENELVDRALCANMHYEDVQLMMFNSVHFVNKLLKTKTVRQAIQRDSDKRTFYFVTFTSDPNKTEIENKCDMDRYRRSHFKNYNHMFVEEKDSAESGKYHQHILIECPLRVVHTKQNLKPAAYYKGNINVKPVTPTKPSIDNIITYMKKDGIPKGSVEHFLKLQF